MVLLEIEKTNSQQTAFYPPLQKRITQDNADHCTDISN